MYYLRDSKGTLKLKVADVVALKLIEDIPFQHSVKKFVSGVEASAFVFKEDWMYTIADTVQIYIWSGDYLIKS